MEWYLIKEIKSCCLCGSAIMKLNDRLEIVTCIKGHELSKEFIQSKIYKSNLKEKTWKEELIDYLTIN